MDCLAGSSSSVPASVVELAKEEKFLAALREWAHLDDITVNFDYHREGADHTPVWSATLVWRRQKLSASAPTKQEAASMVAERIIRGALAPSTTTTHAVDQRLAALEREVADLRIQLAELSALVARPQMSSVWAMPRTK